MTAEPCGTETASATTAGAGFREITDARGRVHRVGETDRQILGRPRWTMVALPWLAVLAISVFEYAFGAAEDTLSSAHHWTSSTDPLPSEQRPSRRGAGRAVMRLLASAVTGTVCPMRSVAQCVRSQGSVSASRTS